MKMSMYSLDHRTDPSPILKGCTCFACKNVRIAPPFCSYRQSDPSHLICQ